MAKKKTKKKTHSGNYFWRGGQKIDVVPEEEFFTAIANDKTDVEELNSIAGVQEVKRVQDQVFKVHVAADKHQNGQYGNPC